jgi:hypothetical protein
LESGATETFPLIQHLTCRDQLFAYFYIEAQQFETQNGIPFCCLRYRWNTSTQGLKPFSEHPRASIANLFGAKCDYLINDNILDSSFIVGLNQKETCK